MSVDLWFLPTEGNMPDGRQLRDWLFEVVFRTPHRGWRRSRRRVSITIDGAEYVARPRTVGSSELVRPDGEAVWRTLPSGRDRMAADVSTIEVTVAALCAAVRLHDRMARNPINFF